MSLSAEELRFELFRRVDQAQVHHDLFIALRTSAASPENAIKLNRHIRFFAGVESALFNSTVILLYTLYETRIDTINFHRLLDALELSVPAPELKGYRVRIKEIKPLWVRVGIIRNEMVGHQSLDLYADPEKTKAKLPVKDVDELLAETRRLLSDISSQQFDIGIGFMEGTRGAIDKLLSRISG